MYDHVRAASISTLLCYHTATQYSPSYEADLWRTSFPKATEIILVAVKTARLCTVSASLGFLAKTAHDFSQTTSDRDSNTAKKKKKSTENTAFPAFLPSHEMMMMTVITTTGSDKNTFRFLVTSVVQYLWFVTYISLILFYREPVGFFLAF